MKIAVVIPHGHCFDEVGATSIDLCAVEFAAHSRYRKTTKFFVNYTANPLSAEHTFYAHKDYYDLRCKIKKFRPDLIVVHQNLKYANFLAKTISVPVVLHRHNYYEPKSALSAWNKARQFNRLANIIFVSDSVAGTFQRDFPLVKTPVSRVYNGVDINNWNPAMQRRPVVVFAGRAHPTKGAIQLLEALISVLPKFPEWSAELYVSRGHLNPGPMSQILNLAKTLPRQISIIQDAQFSKVKEALEEAAISVMPTQDPEPFGRSAIEAMAGGAALIASNLGGLSEVLAEGSALPLNDYSSAGIAEAVSRLIENELLRTSIAAAGRRHVIDNFSLDRTSDTLDRLYQFIASLKS